MTNLIPRAERAIAERLVDRLLYKLDVEEKMDADKRQQQRTKTYLEILELSRHFMGEALTDEKYLSLRDYMKDPDHRWMRLIGDILDNTDPGYAKKQFSPLALRHSSGVRKKSGQTARFTAATSRGSSSLTPPWPATCTASAAGLAPMTTRIP